MGDPRRKTYRILKDGGFTESAVPGRYCGVKSHKIFGRLDCPSGKRKAHQKNRVFFLTWDDAIAAGYRPCKVCKPTPNN
jgi:methylphosphotriester-DNA--protein-cysteine methyltransferase